MLVEGKHCLNQRSIPGHRREGPSSFEGSASRSHIAEVEIGIHIVDALNREIRFFLTHRGCKTCIDCNAFRLIKLKLLRNLYCR
jgi:hypothetical protein